MKNFNDKMVRPGVGISFQHQRNKYLALRDEGILKEGIFPRNRRNKIVCINCDIIPHQLNLKC